jgi:hypothetical protein
MNTAAAAAQECLFYVMPVTGCTDPEPLQGPYANWTALLNAARTVRAHQEEEDSLFWLAINLRSGRPETGAFAAGEIDPEFAAND